MERTYGPNQMTSTRGLASALLLALSLVGTLHARTPLLTKEYIRLDGRIIATEGYLSAAESNAVDASASGGSGVTMSCCVVASADFNGDGIPDLVWQNPSTGAAQIWYMGGSNGAIIQSYATVSTGNTWRIVAAADFNGTAIRTWSGRIHPPAPPRSGI